MRTLYRDYTSQAQIDAQYNASAAVADASAYFRRYAQDSLAARQALPCALDVAYGPTLDETLDIFAAGPGAPVFVFIHGGYWRAFNAKDFSFVARGPQALGITTVVVNYSLCPKVAIDEITRQTRAAVAWVLRHIGEHGGDPARVAVGGHSAGGHLSAMCLQTDWAADYGLPDDPLAAALLLSGIYDIAPLRYSYLQPMIQLDDGVIRRNSPLHTVRACRTPTLVTWGAHESTEFARQARSMHDALQATGNRSELIAHADANHFTGICEFGEPDSPLCRWLARAVRGSGGADTASP
jgi:arylformamidase